METKTIDTIFGEILELGITENYKMIDLKTKEIIKVMDKKIQDENDTTLKKHLEVKQEHVIHTLYKEIGSVAHPEKKLSKTEYKRRYDIAVKQLGSDLIGLFSE